MTKRCLIALVAVFVAGTLLDFLIHGVMLMATYEATAALWRPMAEMKMGLMRLVTLVSAGCFVGIYVWMVQPRSLVNGVKYGLVFGLGTGFSMGFGSYTYMPNPMTLAAGWLVGSLVEAAVAGLMVGAIIKPSTTATQ